MQHNKMLVIAMAALCVIGGLAYGLFGHYDAYDRGYRDAAIATDVIGTAAAVGAAAADAHAQRRYDEEAYPRYRGRVYPGHTRYE